MMGKTLDEQMQEFKRAWRQLLAPLIDPLERFLHWLNRKLERKP